MDRAQQEAEAALKAWDEEVTEEAGTSTGASITTGSTGQQRANEAAEARRRAAHKKREDQQHAQEARARKRASVAAKASRHKLAIAFWVVVAVILIRAVIIAATQHTPSVPSAATTTTSSQLAAVSLPTTPTPQPVSLPEQASEGFDVTPTFESAGSISKNEIWPLKRKLMLNAELEGFLLKVAVNVTYPAATASEVKAYAQEDSEEPLSLAQIVARTEAHITFWNSAHEDERDEIYPVSVHLKQHGLEVYGTITYPAALPGEYEWGSGDEEYKLGTVTTPSLGHAESYVVFKEHRAANNTVLLAGMIPNALEEGDGSLHDVSIAPAGGGESIHPSHVATYRSWHRYFLAVLTFPISSARIGNGSFSSPSGDESIPLTSSEE
jgi:hypothetical protein